MDKDKVLGIIRQKIGEHKYEMDQSQLNNHNIQREIDKAKESLHSSPKEAMIKAGNLMILKDKMMFHKACIATLEDVLEAVQKL